MTRERFAPSPTGYLHLGHAFSALTAWDSAQRDSHDFLLRMEDIDTQRSKPQFVTAIYQDLHWLGLNWPKPVLHQSKRMPAYLDALEKLISLGLCYPCRCSRRDISEALAAPQEGAKTTFGPDGVVYPGTCRHRNIHDREPGDAIRLNMAAAIETLADKTETLTFTEIGAAFSGIHHLNADALVSACGDIVLARRDFGTSYHLSVVVDDHFQRISHVTRGQDMFETTPIHRLLQALLGYAPPIYRHHRLIRDENGKRLAKRDDARAIRKFREEGLSPDQVRKMVGL